jgi:hypothetical protein
MPARTPQDVINAWNAACARCNFDPYQGPYPDTETMGEMYEGSLYDQDTVNFMKSIQQQVQSQLWPDPEELDSVNAVILNPDWYQ